MEPSTPRRSWGRLKSLGEHKDVWCNKRKVVLGSSEAQCTPGCCHKGLGEIHCHIFNLSGRMVIMSSGIPGNDVLVNKEVVKIEVNLKFGDEIVLVKDVRIGYRLEPASSVPPSPKRHKSDCLELASEMYKLGQICEEESKVVAYHCWLYGTKVLKEAKTHEAQAMSKIIFVSMREMEKHDSSITHNAKDACVAFVTLFLATRQDQHKQCLLLVEMLQLFGEEVYARWMDVLQGKLLLKEADQLLEVQIAPPDCPLGTLFVLSPSNRSATTPPLFQAWMREGGWDRSLCEWNRLNAPLGGVVFARVEGKEEEEAVLNQLSSSIVPALISTSGYTSEHVWYWKDTKGPLVIRQKMAAQVAILLKNAQQRSQSQSWNPSTWPSSFRSRCASILLLCGVWLLSVFVMMTLSTVLPPPSGWMAAEQRVVDAKQYQERLALLAKCTPEHDVQNISLPVLLALVNLTQHRTDAEWAWIANQSLSSFRWELEQFYGDGSFRDILVHKQDSELCHVEFTMPKSAVSVVLGKKEANHLVDTFGAAALPPSAQKLLLDAPPSKSSCEQDGSCIAQTMSHSSSSIVMHHHEEEEEQVVLLRGEHVQDLARRYGGTDLLSEQMEAIVRQSGERTTLEYMAAPHDSAWPAAMNANAVYSGLDLFWETFCSWKEEEPCWTIPSLEEQVMHMLVTDASQRQPQAICGSGVLRSIKQLMTVEQFKGWLWGSAQGREWLMLTEAFGGDALCPGEAAGYLGELKQASCELRYQSAVSRALHALERVLKDEGWHNASLPMHWGVHVVLRGVLPRIGDLVTVALPEIRKALDTWTCERACDRVLEPSVGEQRFVDQTTVLIGRLLQDTRIVIALLLMVMGLPILAKWIQWILVSGVWMAQRWGEGALWTSFRWCRGWYMAPFRWVLSLSVICAWVSRVLLYLPLWCITNPLLEVYGMMGHVVSNRMVMLGVGIAYVMGWLPFLDHNVLSIAFWMLQWSSALVGLACCCFVAVVLLGLGRHHVSISLLHEEYEQVLHLAQDSMKS